jgi:hypothetical protein
MTEMISCKIQNKKSTSSSFLGLAFPLHTNISPCSYDFEYEDDDDDQEGAVDVENKYYNAKQMKADSPEDAIIEFLGVPALEEEKGDWGFKGLKQAIKLEFCLKRYQDVAFSLTIFSHPRLTPIGR